MSSAVQQCRAPGSCQLRRSCQTGNGQRGWAQDISGGWVLARLVRVGGLPNHQAHGAAQLAVCSRLLLPNPRITNPQLCLGHDLCSVRRACSPAATAPGRWLGFRGDSQVPLPLPWASPSQALQHLLPPPYPSFPLSTLGPPCMCPQVPAPPVRLPRSLRAGSSLPSQQARPSRADQARPS